MRVPEGWRLVRLGDVARESRRRNDGSAIDGERLYGVFKDEGMVPMRDRVRGASVERCKVVRPGAFAYNPMRLNIGSIACWTGNSDAIVSPDYVVFECDQRQLDHRYLDHLRKGRDWVKFTVRSGDGGVRIRIYFDQLAEFRFFLPPLSEQRRIVEILSGADEAIKTTLEVIEQARIVRRGVLKTLLTKGIGHSRFKTTVIGEIPETWNVCKLGEIAKIRAGATPPRKDADRYFFDGRIPWVKTGDLTNGPLYFTEECITEHAVAETSCRIHPQGTILVAMYGGLQQIGRTGILRVEAATNQAISALIVRDELAIPEFLLCCLNVFRPRWRDIAASSRKDPNIKKEDIYSFLVPIPPMDEQDSIMKVAEALSGPASGEADILNNLEIAKEFLLSDLLTGRKRISADALSPAL